MIEIPIINYEHQKEGAMRSVCCRFLPILLIAIILPSYTFAKISPKELSTQALAECNKGRSAKERDIRLTHFLKGQDLAEQALKLDDHYPDAHYALFCTLGEQLRIDGENLSSIIGFREMMAALDRTLELKPDHLDAISSKGSFLVRLPSILGGDVERGEKMLRLVIKKEPKCINARLTLAKFLADRGDFPEAVQLTKVALKYAEKQNRQDFIPEARETLEKLRSATVKSK